jgi:hypothetical protein
MKNKSNKNKDKYNGKCKHRKKFVHRQSKATQHQIVIIKRHKFYTEVTAGPICIARERERESER